MTGCSFVEGWYYFESRFPDLLTSPFNWFSLNSQRRFRSGQPTFVLVVRGMRLELFFNKPGNINLEWDQTLICGQFFVCLVLPSVLPGGNLMQILRFLTQICFEWTFFELNDLAKLRSKIIGGVQRIPTITATTDLQYWVSLWVYLLCLHLSISTWRIVPNECFPIPSLNIFA